MSNITQRETNLINRQLNLEQLLISKYKYYSSLCNDPQIKAKCEEFCAKHQEHYDKLDKLNRGER